MLTFRMEPTFRLISEEHVPNYPLFCVPLITTVLLVTRGNLSPGLMRNGKYSDWKEHIIVPSRRRDYI